MTEHTTTPAGWYDDGTGRQRWYDGNEWGDYAPPADAAAAVVGTDDANHSAVAGADVPATVIRRTRRAPFNPPAEDATDGENSFTVSRSWGLGLRSANAKKGSGLTRNRKIAGDLPDWAPLPPGELSVDRSAGQPR